MNILFILPPHPFPLTNNLCPISITFPRSLLQFRSRPCFTPRLTSTISSSRFPFSPSPQNLDRSRPPQKHSKKNYSIKFVSYVATSSSFSGSIASLKARLAPYSRTFFPFVYSRLDSPAPQDPRLLSHTVAPQTRSSNVGTTHFRSALPITPVSPQSFGRQAASPSPSRPIPCSRHLPPPRLFPAFRAPTLLQIHFPSLVLIILIPLRGVRTPPCPIPIIVFRTPHSVGFPLVGPHRLYYLSQQFPLSSSFILAR